MSSYILDKAYACEDEGGVEAFRVVVQGTVAGNSMLPGGANEGAILGVTVHGQTSKNGHVAVRKAGIARIVAAGPIPLGAAVVIADTSGKVVDIDSITKTDDEQYAEVVGFAETAAARDGDVIEAFISIHERHLAG